MAKAAVLVEFGQPLVVREFPTHFELAPGEAVVEIEMAGICGTDVHIWRGELPVPLPLILGHEAVGRLRALGPGVTHDWTGQPIQPGDRVTWASSVVCGECYYCRIKPQPTRCLHRKAYGISYNANEPPHLRGGYAEQIYLRAGTALFKLPDDIPTAAVVGAGCGLATAVHGLERCPVHWGEAVVVQGTGPVGLAAIALARISGASRIIAIGGPSHRLELAKHFGADTLIDVATTTAEERRRWVAQESGGFGADVVIECAGVPDAVAEGIELCRDGGRYLVLGQYANTGATQLNPHWITRKQLELRGSWGFEPRHLWRALTLLRDPYWQQRFASEITHRFPLEQVNLALETVSKWESGKSVLVPG